ncbi:hypothetical protein DFS33DRAFT_1454557 [Desarmillaria ectypa]|nr:hypothetical protein DFS33DRAFT_1454557 [Desarmillaria ectypa]
MPSESKKRKPSRSTAPYKQKPANEATQGGRALCKASYGDLFFTQSTLSRHLAKEGRKKDQDALLEDPSALSCKQYRIFVRPDVDKALYLRFKSTEAEGKIVSGPVLVEKRRRFEEQTDVPEDEWLKSEGRNIKCMG